MGCYTDSLREAARRMLRSQGGILHINKSRSESLDELMLQISDKVPSKLEFPEVSYIDSEEVIFKSENNNFSIGENEAPVNFCWVKSNRSDSGNAWADFTSMVLDLATAGYPGCLGCGGPGSEELWDEMKSRVY